DGGSPGAERGGIILRERVRDLAFSKVEMIDPLPAHAPAVREELLRRWYREMVQAESAGDTKRLEIERLREQTYRLENGALPPEQVREVQALLAHFERFKILCVTRSADFPTGARAVNANLHERAVRDARMAGARIPERTDFVPGEPILVERNDYERKLFNGD